jgi:hypothetical protein
MFRLEKELGLEEETATPKIPLKVVPMGNVLDLENWGGRRQIEGIRGEYGLAQFSERLERGDVLFNAYWEEEFVGFVWLELPPVIDAGYPLEENEAYTHDGWTFEKYRGKRALPFIQQAVFNYVRENHPEIQFIVTHVAAWNKPSLAGDQRAGYLITRRDLSVVIFGFHKKFALGTVYQH